MLVSELQRSVANALPPGARMTPFLDVTRWVMRRIRAYGDTRGGWSFDWNRGQIDLVASYDTGTVAITNGATTVTGTGTTFTSAMAGRKMRIGGVAYIIDSFTDTTHVELATAYGAATETAATYTIYQDEYAVASGAANIHRIWDKENNHTLDAISQVEMGDKDFLGESPGTVSFYTIAGRNSSGVFLIQFHPYPTAIARLEYWYQADITQISGIGSTLDIPAFFDELVKQGAHARQMQVLRMDGWRDEFNNFGEMLHESWLTDNPLRDARVRMARDDMVDTKMFLFRTARNVTVT